MSDAVRILILGGDSDGNLGDRAIAQAMLRELGAVDQAPEVTILSADGATWAGDPRLHVLPRGLRGLPALWRSAATSDLVLCGGGGLFQDDDSLVKMPYWGLRVAMIRVLCPHIVGYSLGVGPLRTVTSRLFARLAFACMERISVRDPRAYDTSQPLTHKVVSIVPDPALMLPAVSRDTARRWLAEHGVPQDGTPLIGFTTRRWFPARNRLIPHRVASRFRHPAPPSAEANRMTQLLAQALDRLVEHSGARILFLPTYTTRAEGDDLVCAAVRDAMAAPSGPILRMTDPALYKGVVAELRALVSGRMHPTIFAVAAGTPVVGLAYNQKFHGFFELAGLSEYVMDMEQFVHAESAEELARLVRSAMDRGPVAPAHIAQLMEQVRQFNQSLFEVAA